MLKYPESYMRGMPDLLFWKDVTDEEKEKSITSRHTPSYPTENTYTSYNSNEDSLYYIRDHTVFAVEVKSANDVLSKWQSLWLELLRKAGVIVEILKIENASTTT